MMLLLKVILGILLLISVALNALALWRAWIFVRQATGKVSLPSKPSVSLLVPVCGVEGDGLEHFGRFCRLNWPDYQVVFTVLDRADPAIEILQKLSSRPGCEISLQIGGDAVGENLKIRNLLNAFPSVRHDWMVICDADIQPQADFLEGLMEPLLSNEKVGLVHSLYRCEEEPTLASSWENVWINCDFWSHGLLGDWIKGTDFAFGAAMAMHRETLQKIGGLNEIRDYLADDYQLGHRVAAAGRKVVFNQSFVSMQSAPQSWSGAWKHLLRWSKTIRVCQPGGFFGSILTNITLFAMVALIINPSLFLPWSGLALLLRVLFANQCRNWILSRRGLWNRWWLILFKDLAQVTLWLLAFRNSTIQWRGKIYALRHDGKLGLKSGRCDF
jgi:ceramide glucosyltransferase